jgi:TP901 family phage tail tape measure protein
MDFNKEMANVGTLIPGNVGKLKEFKKEIQDLSVDTAKGTTDLTKGLFQVISTFGESTETMDQLKIASRASVAGVSETADAIGLLGLVSKNYNDTSEQMLGKISDLAFMTNKLGVTTFPEMATSMGKVVPIAKAANVKMEEIFGTIATGTGVTGNTVEVVTQFRGILSSLLKPTADMANLYKHLGVESGAALIKQVGLRNAITTIVRAAETTKMPLGKFIGRVEGQTLALALAGAQSDTYAQKLAAMQDVTGATEAAFREQTEGINKAGFAFEQAKQRLIVMAQRIGDMLLPQLVKLINNYILPLIKWFTNLSGGMKKNIIIFAALAAILGPIITIGGIIIAVFAKIGVIASLIIIGITALVSAFTFLYNIWDDLGTPLKVLLALLAPMITIPILIMKNWKKLVSFFKGIGGFIGRFFGFGEKVTAVTGTAGAPGEGTIGNVTKNIEEKNINKTTTNESVVKLDISGAPKGSKVTVEKTKAPLDINLGLQGSF